jgi:transposase
VTSLHVVKKAAATIKKHLEAVVAIVATGLNNGTEGLNGEIRVTVT